jgi:hypothetical protein
MKLPERIHLGDEYGPPGICGGCALRGHSPSVARTATTPAPSARGGRSAWTLNSAALPPIATPTAGTEVRSVELRAGTPSPHGEEAFGPGAAAGQDRRRAARPQRTHRPDNHDARRPDESAPTSSRASPSSACRPPSRATTLTILIAWTPKPSFTRQSRSRSACAPRTTSLPSWWRRPKRDPRRSTDRRCVS